MQNNHSSPKYTRKFLALTMTTMIWATWLAATAASQAPNLSHSTSFSAGTYEVSPGQLRFPPQSPIAPVSHDNQLSTARSGKLTLSSRIHDGPGGSTPANSIDDVEFFVRQHYLDFLNREADPSGLAFWVNNIISCGSDPGCLEVKHIDTSAAFFLSIEFQQTGYLVHRTYKAAFGNIQNKPIPLKLSEFLPDTRAIGLGVVVGAVGWESLLENKKVAYFNEFVTRARFTAAYPTAMTPAQFVGALDLNAGGVLSAAERNSLVNALASGAKTRAQVLRAVVEDSDLASREFNKAFVLMQYFGYLRRNADEAPDNNQDGFNFWLAKLNQFSGDFRRAEMVKAFIVAGEYRARFISGRQVLSTMSGNISSGFGTLQLPGVMEIELSDNSARPPMNFTLRRVSAPTAMAYFRNDIEAEGLPPVSTSSLLEILAPQTFPGFMGLRVHLPDEILANVTAGLEPRLYVFVADRTDLEASGEFIPLDSAYDPATGNLSAPLPGSYFFEAATSNAQIHADGSVQPEAVDVSAQILVSVAKIATRTVPVTGSFTTPASDVVEARVRETINITGSFNVKIPVSLQRPTTLDVPPRRGYDGIGHFGIDFRANEGDPILAAQRGTVYKIFEQSLDTFRTCDNGVQVREGGGLTVQIKHEDDSLSGYAHLLPGSVSVPWGAQVAAGQQIARADHTGGVCPPGPGGAHLHFGHRVDGQRVDPTKFFTNDPQQFEQDWLSQLSFVVSVNGNPVEATRKPVTGRQFTYTAPLDLAALPNIETGKTYPLVVSVQIKDDGPSMTIYNGKLKVLPTAMRVVLTWDKPDTDVDLHVMDSEGRESWYQNLCGIPNGCLDHDDIDGFGPETFSLTQFEQRLTYRVFLHYYSDHGNGSTTATVKVYVDDQLVTENSATLSNGQILTIGTYPQPPPRLVGQIFNHLFPEKTLLQITLKPTSDPRVWEYSVPGLPKLHIVRKE